MLESEIVMELLEVEIVILDHSVFGEVVVSVLILVKGGFFWETWVSFVVQCKVSDFFLVSMLESVQLVYGNGFVLIFVVVKCFYVE